MERESFEDDQVAEVLNKYFISIKVDREERPDIDSIYMNVCQALTGHGGWPMTIIMTHEKKPFFAGTYFPKNGRMGMKGLLDILKGVEKTWNSNREELINASDQILEAVNRQENAAEEELRAEMADEAFNQLKHSFDSVYGGFGDAPKFPIPHNLYFLLRYWYKTKEKTALDMVEKTLNAMYKGGIYDHIGYGFSRYSTDRRWLVPHFEKMLYDNALLAIAYLETYQATGDQKYSKIARQIFVYTLRDMTSEEGGFYSAEDADSEGEEGKFYIWTADEIKQILGDEEGNIICQYYNITEKGNFEGRNIPNLIKTSVEITDIDTLDKSREKLFEIREKRIHPFKDNKILTGWNGLMIAALAIGARILGETKYLSAAEKAAAFIYKKLVRKDGRLLARFREGDAAFNAYADDYAFLIWGLIELYEAAYEPEYLEKALSLNDDLIKYFWDDKNGGLFIYGNDSEQLITRPKEIYDGATPSGNSVSAVNFIRLARLTGISELEVKAEQLLKAFGSSINNYPAGYSNSLSALMLMQSKGREIVIAEDSESIESKKMIGIINEKFRPFTVSILSSSEKKNIEKTIPFLSEYKPVNGRPAAYICENFSCQLPVSDIEVFKQKLDQ